MSLVVVQLGTCFLHIIPHFSSLLHCHLSYMTYLAYAVCVCVIHNNMKSSQKTPTFIWEVVTTHYICFLCFFKAPPQSAMNEAESNTETPLAEFQVSIKTLDKTIPHNS